MNTPANREVAIFNAALELPASQRGAYLQEACADDPALRLRLEALLRDHEAAGAFLETPPPGAGGLPIEAEVPGLAIRIPVPPSEKAGDRIGRYKLLQQIGEGGCGVVYMAEQEEPVRRKVALKVIKLGMDTKSVIARFEAERQAVALMDHPSIAKVFDAGATEAGRPYFVMELVKGVPITRYCDENNLSTVARLGLFVQVCQAIQHAHQKGIIHRDIKPSNILVGDHDGVPVPKIIDFGIAKATTDQRLTDKTLFTAFEQFIGTPAYMSPEQAKLSGLDIDTRSDIYSLGVLLYELLTSKTPFGAKHLLEAGLDEVRRIIREEEPPRPSTRLDTLDAAEQTTVARHRQSDPPKLVHLIRGDLDWIVMKALDKDRGRRYETVNALAADVKRHLNNEPVVARPPSTAYRLQKAWRRNKLAVTTAAVMAAALVVGTGVSSWQAIEARKARNAEKEQRLAAQAAQQAEKQARLRADAEKAQAGRLLYVANLNLAQQAWEQKNFPLLRQLLEEAQASPDRGFEWYYWQRQTHLALKTLRGHLDPVRSVAFSPDGQRIVTGSNDATAKVWEAASGRELLRLKGHTSWIRSVAFSPDGQRILTGGGDQTAKVWEAAGGRELLTLKGHDGGINSVAFSPDGRRIVTGSDDATAKVWEADGGRELLTLKGHSAPIWAAAFSPDGRRIVTGSDDATAMVWEAASGRQLFALKGHRAPIYSVAFSPDGRRVVTGSWDMTAKVWEAAGGRELLTLKGLDARINAVAFSPDGQQIVTGSDDWTAKVWEAASGRELLTLKGHDARVNAVAFSPDRRRIVTGSEDATAKLWDAAGNREPLTLEGHDGWIRSVAFSPDGRRIVTSSGDWTAKVWEAASGHELLTLKGHDSWLGPVAFSPDGQRIVTGSGDQTARVWEASSGRELLTLKGHSAPIWAAAFSPDGRRIVTGSVDATARVWETAGGRELLTLKGHTASIWSVAFSPDGRRIVTGSGDQQAKVWDAASGQELLALKGHTSWIRSVAFSPDGRRILTGSDDGTAKLWEAAGGRQLDTLTGHSAPIWAAAFSPDGRRIVTASDDATAKLWEAASGQELLTLKGEHAPIRSVAFSPDGRRIVTGSEDATAKVWLAATAEQVAAWQAEERTAAQTLAPQQRERATERERRRLALAGDPGAIKRWLILMPIALPTGQRGTEAVDTEQVEGEGRLRPKAGDTRAVGKDQLQWRQLALDDYVIDLNEIQGHETPFSVAYAVCYIWSEAAQRGLRMLVGSDDEAKVYLNGKQVHKCPFLRAFIADQDTVPDLALNAGLNVLVFKVVNEAGDWKGSIRLTDAAGQSLKGIRVTLDPEGKDLR
jgi:WD40 repeat protein/serine/threonine protein kinase